MKMRGRCDEIVTATTDRYTTRGSHKHDTTFSQLPSSHTLRYTQIFITHQTNFFRPLPALNTSQAHGVSKRDECEQQHFFSFCF